MQEHDYNQDDKIEEYQDPKPVPRLDKLFCMRCGHQLVLESINETTLIELYKCSNEHCVHHGCLLDFCHPVYPNRGPGESYALCWVK